MKNKEERRKKKEEGRIKKKEEGRIKKKEERILNSAHHSGFGVLDSGFHLMAEYCVQITKDCSLITEFCKQV